MNETTAVFIGIIIGVFLVLFCCAILYVYIKITKKIEDFMDTERRAFTKVHNRAEEKYSKLSDRVKALEDAERKRRRENNTFNHKED